MEDNLNEVTIKMYVTEDVTKEFLMSAINGLNDSYLPVNEIFVNGKLAFNNKQGFVKEDNK